MRNIDITGFAYDALGKRYVAWTSDGELVFLSPEGERQSARKLADKMPGFGETYDRNNERPPVLTVVPRGNDIALVTAGRRCRRSNLALSGWRRRGDDDVSQRPLI